MERRMMDLAVIAHGRRGVPDSHHLRTTAQSPAEYVVSEIFTQLIRILTFLKPSQWLTVRVRPDHLFTLAAGIGFR
jgi:hypothetical protein